MNAVARLSPADLPAAAAPIPPLSPDLAAAADRLADFELRHMGWPRPSAPMIEEARGAMAAYDREAGPARPSAITAWLMPISGAVRNPASEGDFNRLVAGVAVACDHLPGWAFNRATIRAGLAAWKFLPSAADVVELLTAHVKPHADRAAALRRIADASPVTSGKEAAGGSGRTETPEERAAAVQHVSGVVAAYVAEVAGRRADERPRRQHTGHLTGDALAAARAAAGIKIGGA